MSVQTLFVCPCCGESGHVRTPETTPGKNASRMERTRECGNCGAIFETHEAVKRIVQVGNPERVAEAKRRWEQRPRQLEMFGVVEIEHY